MANGDDYSIQILLDCVERGRIRGNQRPPSICMVANVFRDVNPSCFNPQMLSIGPLHRENKKLKKSQGLKESYLHELVQYLESAPDEILKECLQKVYDSIEEIKASYAGIEKISDEDLANMMVMDGCFILEFIRKILSREYVNEIQNHLISQDLLLLENQIPFFVLQNLFDCTLQKKNPSTISLTKIVHEVFETKVNLFGTRFPNQDVATDSTSDHLLGCLHKCYQPSHALHPGEVWTQIPSAAELDRSGVKFKAHQDTNYPLSMKFESSGFSCFNYSWGKPTLLMPAIYIGDKREKILRNFIAYELSYPHVHFYFASYAYVMDMLVDTEEDIGKLIESNVIVNLLGSKKDAADMFNKLCKDIPLPYCYYGKECEQLKKYYNGFWPKHIARLKRTYFSNPWCTIAFIAAITLFLLAMVQTVFTILAVV